MAEHAGHGPRPPSTTPTPQILTRIIEKEREIERTIQAAQEEAARRLQEAKARAAQMASGHEEAARGEAARLKEGLLADARRQADEILREGKASAEAIRATPENLLETAAERLLAMALPGRGR
jgi:vacuolar-type H+-ATPase subunit H